MWKSHSAPLRADIYDMTHLHDVCASGATPRFAAYLMKLNNGEMHDSDSWSLAENLWNISHGIRLD